VRTCEGKQIDILDKQICCALHPLYCNNYSHSVVSPNSVVSLYLRVRTFKSATTTDTH
jgi:hypothetical protein